MGAGINQPHGELLVNGLLPQDQQQPLIQQSKDWPSWFLNQRQLCDLELLLTGAFSPLTGFMSQEDYQSVLHTMRLANGLLWPIPIMLDVEANFAEQIELGQKVVLRDPEGVALAILTVEEKWQPDLMLEANAVYGTQSTDHLGVAYLIKNTNPYYISGKLQGLQLPNHVDFSTLRLTPTELRERLSHLDRQNTVAFQTRNPMHRAHMELTLRAADEVDGNILIHPVVGMTAPGDIDYMTRVRCYQALLPYYPKDRVQLALLPLSMRMAGPREALWHAIIRKNYGCSHFIVGRDHAAPSVKAGKAPFYEANAANELLQKYENELGITIVPFQKMVYVEQLKSYCLYHETPKDMSFTELSGTQLRKLLREDKPIPEWFTFPEVAKELKKSCLPKSQQGITLFLTGLSGAGKSTIANLLYLELLGLKQRTVTLLDGDVIRSRLSTELGFSHEDRSLNILRIGYVASEITKHCGIAICALIAPYADCREKVREMVEGNGSYVEIFLSTPLEVCESRDPKGHYAKARSGVLSHFTGISDPYENPADAEIVIDTSDVNAQQCVVQIVNYLKANGYIVEDKGE